MKNWCILLFVSFVCFSLISCSANYHRKRIISKDFKLSEKGNFKLFITEFVGDSVIESPLTLSEHFRMQYTFYDKYWSDSAKAERKAFQESIKGGYGYLYQDDTYSPLIAFHYRLPKHINNCDKKRGKVQLAVVGIETSIKLNSSGSTIEGYYTTGEFEFDACRGYFPLHYTNIVELGRINSISEESSMTIKVVYNYTVFRKGMPVDLIEDDTLTFNVPFE